MATVISGIEELNYILAEKINSKGLISIKEKLNKLSNDILADSEDNKAMVELYMDFVTSVYTLALTNSFDIDVDVKTTKFFCKDLVEQLEYIGKNIDGNLVNTPERASANILAAQTRNIPLKEYLNGDAAEEDFLHIQSMLEQVGDGVLNPLDQLYHDFFKENGFINSLFDRKITQVLAVYDKAFGAGFELTPNYGVVSLTKSGVFILKRSKVTALRSVAFTKLSNLLKGYIPCAVAESSRQFDVDLILKSDKPVYFPMKILEYSLGRITTENCNHNEYKDFDGGKGWDSYAEGYVRGNVKHFLELAVRNVIERLFKEDDIPEVLKNPERIVDISQDIENAVEKCVESFTTLVIVSELEGNIESWALIELKTVSKNFKGGTHPKASVLVGNIIKTVQGGQGNVSGADFSIQNEYVDVLSSDSVVTYKHVFDPVLANKKPLFACQALDTLIERGEKLSWENILLGKGLDGKMVKSGEGQRIDLRKQLFHLLIAGSRSGKGVHSQEIAETSSASNIPMFYIDNKPDIATMFKQVGRNKNMENMFLVNGRNHEAQFDPLDDFNMDKAPLDQAWKGTIPDFWDAHSYEDIGDLVYYRGVIFVLGILMLRFWSKTTMPEVYQQLNGDGGIIAFFDEFTKWQRNFSTVRLNPRGGANSFLGDDTYISKEELREYKGVLQDLQILLGKSEDELKDAERKNLRKLQNQVEDLRKPYRAYATDLYLNLERSINKLYDMQVAGFANTEEHYSDIFIVGQDIDTKPLPDNARTFGRTKSGKFSSTGALENACILTTFFYNFSTDYFMGYNSAKPTYMAANDPSAKTHDTLTATSRSFAYFKGRRETVMSGSASTINSNAVIYKPYLILNNALEPDVNQGMSQTEIESACGKAEVQYVGGVIKNLGKDWWKLRESLIDNEGVLRKDIGFEGFLDRVVAESGQPINLNSSGDMANMIVKQMGYSGNYLEFLCDLRPEWNFGASDLIDAFAQPEIFASGERRTATYNQLFRESKQEDSQDSISSDSENLEEGNMFETEYEDSGFKEPTNLGVNPMGVGGASIPSSEGYSNDTEWGDPDEEVNIGQNSEFNDWNSQDEDFPVDNYQEEDTYDQDLDSYEQDVEDDQYSDSEDENFDEDVQYEEEDVQNEEENVQNESPSLSQESDIQENKVEPSNESQDGVLNVEAPIPNVDIPVSGFTAGVPVSDVPKYDTQTGEKLPEQSENESNSEGQQIVHDGNGIQGQEEPQLTRAELRQQQNQENMVEGVLENLPAEQETNLQPMTRSERYKDLHNQQVEDVQPTAIRSPQEGNGESFMIDYQNLVNMITSDILKTVGGIDNINQIRVKDCQLIVNNLRYSKRFPMELVKGLPKDRQLELANSRYANLFNFGVLSEAHNLVHLELDSAYMFNTKFSSELNIKRNMEGIVELFNKVPKLYSVSVEGREYLRDQLEEDIIKGQNFFRSKEKRSMISDMLYASGKEQTKSSWNTTKELYSRKGIWNKITGTAMLGITGVKGVATGGLGFGRRARQGFTEMMNGLNNKR